MNFVFNGVICIYLSVSFYNIAFIANQITHYTDHPVHEKVLIWFFAQKVGLFVLGVTHISNFPTVSVKLMQMGGCVWHSGVKDLTHEILIFVKILFNFKKRIA